MVDTPRPLGPAPVGPASVTPQELAQHATWNNFLQALHQAIRMGQLLEPDNKNMSAHMERAIEQHGLVARASGGFTFLQSEENIFVNNQRLRCDGPTYMRHRQFLELLAARKIAGLQIRQVLTREQWNNFVLAVARYNRESTSPFQDCVKQVEARGLAGVVELTPIDAGARGKAARSAPLERRAFAARTFAKAMSLLRVYIAALDEPSQRGYYHLKLMRVVQDLVTVCLERGWKHLGLVNNKHHDDYLYSHSVNVALIALILGVETGLKRAHLQELGMAALLHDLGKAFLPPELLRKSRDFTEEERKRLMQHPVLGVQALLRVGQFNESLLKRIMAICEHHEAIKGAPRHFYSRAIAVAETFDALTSVRPYRPAFMPDVAVKMLIGLAGQRLDRDLVRLFVRTFGLFPCGTCVELNSGETAVCAEPSADAKMWMSPLVRVVRDKSGLPYRQPRVVDLSRVEGTAETARYIAKVVDPAPLGINASGVLFADASG